MVTAIHLQQAAEDGPPLPSLAMLAAAALPLSQAAFLEPRHQGVGAAGQPVFGELLAGEGGNHSHSR